MRDSHRWKIIGAAICAAQLGAMPRPIESQPAPDPPPGEEVAQVASASVEEPAETGTAKPPSVEPPDGKWLLEEDGRRYFIETIPKGVEGEDWVWIGEDEIRIYGGLPLDVATHDADTFSVKVYEILPYKKTKTAPTPPSEEELAELAASYRPDGVVEGDVLRFADFDRGLPRSGQWRNGFDVADMNGDGHLDIVFGAPRKGLNRPHVFLGDGQGSWRLWDATYPSLSFDYGDAEAEDFDGDGHLDIALGMHLIGVVVLKGNGAGKFVPWTEGIGRQSQDEESGPSFSSRAITAADWNQDGKPDLVAFGEGMGSARRKTASNGIMVYFNDGDGTWTGQAVPSRYFGDAVDVGDVNGDGRPDVAAANSTIGSKEILYLGKEDGTWELTAVDGIRRGAWIKSVALARLDGDGLDDVLVGYSNSDLDGVWRTGVDVIHGSRDGDGRRRTLFAAESRATIYALDTGDVDGDGRVDVVALTGHGEAWVFLGREDGRFLKEASPELPQPAPGCFGYGLRLVDLDGDGRDEIVASFAGEPTGLPGITSEPGCPGQGSVRVWAARPAAGEKSGSAGRPARAAGPDPGEP